MKFTMKNDDIFQKRRKLCWEDIKKWATFVYTKNPDIFSHRSHCINAFHWLTITSFLNKEGHGNIFFSEMEDRFIGHSETEEDYEILRVVAEEYFGIFPTRIEPFTDDQYKEFFI